MVMRCNGNVWVSEGIPPHTLNLGNRWSWAASFTP